MRNCQSNVSLSALPKITSQYIEELIRERKKLPILSKEYDQMAYKKRDCNKPQQRTNRHTESLYHLGIHEFKSQFMSKHIDIRSPFYKRISAKNIAQQCKCRCALKSNGLPSISRTHCEHHNEIAMQKSHNMKQFHESIIAQMKENYQKIHQFIEKNHTQYIESSIQKSAKIKHQKAILSEINQFEIENKRAKALKDAQQSRQFTKTLLKERFQKMYTLDDENQPFEKILMQRDRWQAKRGKLTQNLTIYIQKKLLQINENKQKLEKENKSKRAHDQLEQEKILKDLQKCLGLVMKNVSSIGDLLPKFQSKDAQKRIDQIFRKTLNFEVNHKYLRKLRKKMGQIIENICVKKADIKGNTIKNFQKVQSNKDENALQQVLNQEIPSIDSRNISTNEKHQQNQSTITTQNSPTELISQMKASETLESLSLISSIPSINRGERQKDKIEALPSIHRSSKSNQKQKVSVLSNKSTISKKKISTLSKLSFMSNSLKRSSVYSVKRRDSREATIDSPALSKTFSNSVPNSGINDKQSSSTLQNPLLVLPKKPLNYSTHITPLATKHVICEQDQLLISEEDDDDIEYQTERRLKKMMARRQRKERENEIEQNRIDGMINLYKQKINNLKEGREQENPIPQKYRSINFEKFCSQSTFLYIVQMSQKFEGTKKFKFIYNQLRLKKRILDDNFVEDVVKEFSSMFESDEEINQWKEYILQWRGKVMLEKLNSMIDAGMLELNKDKEETEEEEIEKKKGNDGETKDCEIKQGDQNDSDGSQDQRQQEPQQCGIFKQLDQSQLAFQHYLRKLIRKNRHPTYRPLNQPSESIPQPPSTQRQQIISQKTIDENLEANSTKTIRYTIIDHSPSKENKNKFEFEELIGLGRMDLKSKKKVLEYLLRKKPKQFKLLNKNVTEVVQLFGGSRVVEKEEKKTVESLNELTA